MRVVFNPNHARHHPKGYFKGGRFVEHPEHPDRAASIEAALHKAGHDFIEAPNYGPAPRAAVHTPDYLGFLETIYDRWAEIDPERTEVMPNMHPGRHMSHLPSGLIGRLGYFTGDMSSPIGPHTFATACQTANVAIHTARQVLDAMADNGNDKGDGNGAAPCAYGLGRPPGHHAFSDQAGGFCFLNNIAIAAEVAVREGKRVAILDVDVHHGNGTQGIFYARRDVLTVSLHCDADDFYPFFAGQPHEQGEGEGRGANINLPLPRGSSDNSYLDTLGRALDVIRTFAPDVVFIALGFDGYEHDPFEGFRITTEGFGRIATAIAELGLPTVLIQEGGYNVEDLGKNVAAFLDNFERTRGKAV